MDEVEVAELRKKLEMRSWFLRASLALNVSLITGMVVAVFTRVVF